MSGRRGRREGKVVSGSADAFANNERCLPRGCVRTADRALLRSNPEQPNRVLIAAGPTVVTGKDGLLTLGFQGFVSMKSLVGKGLPPDPTLRNCGLYAVVTPPRYEPHVYPVYIGGSGRRGRLETA